MVSFKFCRLNCVCSEFDVLFWNESVGFSVTLRYLYKVKFHSSPRTDHCCFLGHRELVLISNCVRGGVQVASPPQTPLTLMHVFSLVVCTGGTCKLHIEWTVRKRSTKTVRSLTKRVNVFKIWYRTSISNKKIFVEQNCTKGF